MIAILACFLFACSPQGKEFQESASGKQGEPKGTIRVSGAWALYPMMVKWGEEYSRLHPEIRIDVSAGGAGKGAADALAGMVDIGMVSREIKPEEIAQGGFFVPVVKDAVFPMVCEQNPVLSTLSRKGLKQSQFIDLWIRDKRLTWGDVTGTASREKVQVYTRSDSCGAAETWAKYLGGKHQEDLKGIGVYGDPGLAEAVRKDPLGIGYNNLNFAYDSKSGSPIAGLRVVPIDVNENGRVDAKELLDTKERAIQAVTSGAYPSPPARDLYLLGKGRFKDPTKSFVRWILTDGQRFVEEVGYIPLARRQLEGALERIGD
ncbi:MAG: substrate-binding domain-containing protein [candidate division NC10 bacterium]|nr:substrate-binding domain-containing protein [candidate division NC10 bacterium]